MSETFTASNGVNRFNVVANVGVLFTDAEFDALREFFQHERDTDLGRWRWPENPDWVVYHGNDHEVGVVVINERTLEKTAFTRKSATGLSEKHRAVRAFFDAHPESKPWHDAKPGDVWILTVDGAESAFHPSKSLDRAFTPVAPETGRTAVGMDSFEITAGRRIWPEGDK